MNMGPRPEREAVLDWRMLTGLSSRPGSPNPLAEASHAKPVRDVKAVITMSHLSIISAS
jgi:hypothetical protein